MIFTFSLKLAVLNLNGSSTQVVEFTDFRGLIMQLIEIEGNVTMSETSELNYAERLKMQ